MRRGAPILTLFLTIFLTSCLQFEIQTLSYRYDKGSDTLRIFQNYGGIYGGDAKGKLGKPISGKEMSQLQSVLNGQRTFFFANWIFEYDRSTFEEALAKLKDPGQQDENLSPEEVVKIEKFLRMVLINVHVENGPFYIGADKKLSGVQMVHMTNFSSFVEAFNEIIPIYLNQEAEFTDSPADKRALDKFLKSRKSFLQRDGNTLLLQWSISRGSYDETFGPASEEKEALAKARAAGLGITYKDEVVTFKLGKRDDEITSLTLKSAASATYLPNLVEPARRKHVVKEDFDPAAAARKFLMEGKK